MDTERKNYKQLSRFQKICFALYSTYYAVLLQQVNPFVPLPRNRVETNKNYCQLQKRNNEDKDSDVLKTPQ